MRASARGAWISDNITVTSIVGRYLEHARVYYFENGGEPEVFIGSADLMPRNLNRRVETLYPVENHDIQRIVMEKIFKVHLADNVQARYLRADGSYERRHPTDGELPVNSQIRMIEQRDPWLIA